MLIELSSTAERSLRQDDIVARYGGEEFVVFLPELSAEEAKVVADRLRETISKIVVYSDQGEQVTFTVSIGISSSAISDNIDMLIKTSDEALYRAKENGRNRCEIFTVDDLKNFNAAIEYKDDSANHHPIFDKENTQEISLLDGIDANHILDSQTQIETPAPKTSAPAAEASVPSAGNAAETPVWNADAFAEPLPRLPAAETHEVVESGCNGRTVGTKNSYRFPKARLRLRKTLLPLQKSLFHLRLRPHRFRRLRLPSNLRQCRSLPLTQPPERKSEPNRQPPRLPHLRRSAVLLRRGQRLHRR